MIYIYVRFASNGRVMLTDLTDVCDEEEVKSVHQLQDRGKKAVCQCTVLSDRSDKFQWKCPV
jgi:hypothetical protein